MSLRTPAPVSLRNGASGAGAPAPSSGLATSGARERDVVGAGMLEEAKEFGGRSRVFIIGLIFVAGLAAALGGLYFALQGPMTP